MTRPTDPTAGRTPERWLARPLEGSTEYLIYRDPPDKIMDMERTVACVHGLEPAATARLIASAPTLRALLEECAEVLMGTQRDLRYLAEDLAGFDAPEGLAEDLAQCADECRSQRSDLRKLLARLASHGIGGGS